MVLKNAQELCDIKIICEGIEVIDQMINEYTSPRSSNSSSISRVSPEVVDETRGGVVPLKRLMSNSLWLFIRSRFLSPGKRKNYLDQLELVLPSHYVSVPQ